MNWFLIYFLSFLFVFLLTGVLIPNILRIAVKKKLYDDFDERKIHTTPIPRLGGVAFFPAILFAMALAFGIFCKYYPEIMSFLSEKSTKSLCFLTCAVVLLYLVGIADDLIGLKYRAKFVVQIMAASLIIFGGLRMENLHGFLFIHELPMIPSVLLTVLLMVWHHLFNFASWLLPDIGWQYWMGYVGRGVSENIAAYGDICVQIFAFMSGYALWLRPDAYSTLSK